MAVHSTGRDPSERWLIYGHEYSPNPAIEFSLNFLGRDWFGTGLKTPDALTFARLLLSIYAVQAEGLLMSKKDAMRMIGAEHVSTIRRHTDLAIERGILRMERSQLDRRAELLVLTDFGIKTIEKELQEISRSARWLRAALKEAKKTGDEPQDDETASQLHDSITVKPPALEKLTLVNDVSLGLRTALTAEGSRPHIALLRAPAKSFARYNAAYSETLRLLPNNLPALHARLHNYEFLRDYESALADVNQLEQLEPGHHLVRRADIYVELGQYDLAIKDINRELELYPDNQSARSFRALAYAGKGEWQKALDDVSAVARPNREDNPEWWVYLRGRAHAALGHKEEAIADLEYAYGRTMEYVWMHQGPDFHKTFSIGEESRREAESWGLERAEQIKKIIEDLGEKISE
jgi:tetratricopeptide (TPR) repeat protein